MKDVNLNGLATLALIALSLILVGCGGEPAKSHSAPRVTAGPTTVPPAQGLYRLTILHNGNGESQLIDLGSGLEDFGGVARFAAVVKREKQAVPSAERSAGKSGVIMVSAGDNVLAGAEFSVGRRAGTFYDALALDLIYYDAIALGNHDFDFGPEVLAEFIKQVSRSRVPFLSSNLDLSGELLLRDLFDEGRIAESVVVEGGRIGIVGAINPDLSIISSPRKVKIISDVAEEVQAEVDRLESSGVNKIVLISHMQDVNADIALVSQLNGVDVLVAGGNDELLANESDLVIPGDDAPFGPYPIMATDRNGDRVPVVSTSGRYAYLGKLVVTFDPNGRIVDIDQDASRPIRIASGDDPFPVQSGINKMQTEIIGPLKKGLDDLAQPIATSRVDLDGRRSEVRSRETNQGNLMADALLWQARRLALDYGATLPDVAIHNGGAIRNDLVLPAGQIRELVTFDMAPFSNIVTVVEGISRSQFKEILENAVSRAVDGDTAGGTGRFAQVSGFSFEWVESGTAQVLDPEGTVQVAGNRVQRVVLDLHSEVIVSEGRVVPGSDLTVATLDFLARGGDEYPFRGAPLTALGVINQEALTNYIQFPEGLDGAVIAADYPEGGEGRIKRLP